MTKAHCYSRRTPVSSPLATGPIIVVDAGVGVDRAEAGHREEAAISNHPDPAEERPDGKFPPRRTDDAAKGAAGSAGQRGERRSADARIPECERGTRRSVHHPRD